MANVTENGVCYDLTATPFFVDYRGVRFYFSSNSHAKKFEDKIKVKSEWMSDSFTRRFHFKVDAAMIAVMQLYCQVETRGFRILYNNVEYRRREDVCLTSQIL